MKWIPIVGVGLAGAIASIASGCGGATRRDDSARRAATTSAAARPRPANRAVSPVVAHVAGRLAGDEDDDDGPGEGQVVKSLDKDGDFDRDVKGEGGYYDHDDSLVRDFGHLASAPDSRKATAFVKRYYAAAVAEDGAAACLLLYRTYAATVVEDDGSSLSPTYQRGKTCATVMAKIFTHLHAELTVPVEVVAVRVSGPMAYVLLGSMSRPASYVRLHREGSRWKLFGTIARPLP